MCSSAARTSGITSRPSTVQRPRRSIAQRDVQHRALFGEVDRLAGEHLIAQRLDAGLARQAEQRRHRILRDQVLRVIDEQVVADLAGRIGRRAPDPSRTDRADVREARMTRATRSGDAPSVAGLRADPTRGSRLRTPCRCGRGEMPSGSSSNSRTLPPPSTTYSAAMAARSNSAPSSTAARHASSPSAIKPRWPSTSSNVWP